jgi:hypothetical protein
LIALMRRSFSATVLLASLAACATNYGGAPLSGRVVDAQTKQPLEGVIVMQYWELRKPTVVGHSEFAGVLHLEETVSDRQGQYSFRSWGPVSVPFRTVVYPTSPSLYLFKPGYLLEGQSNFARSRPSEAHEDSRSLRSEWDNHTFELKPAAGSRDYDRLMQEFQSNFSFIFRKVTYQPDCHWVKIPRMISEIYKEKQKLLRAGDSSVIAVDLERFPDQDSCGNASTVFGDYLK